MNAAVNEITHIQTNAHIASALDTARKAVQTLNERGIAVIAALANGRRPVLMVDCLPFGAMSVIKRSHPNGHGGTTVVRATEYEGCQLEWMYDVDKTGLANCYTFIGNVPNLTVVGHG